MKKKTSLRTIGPMSAISACEEGSTPFSESSCRPVITSWAATKHRMTVVTRKNFCRLMRTLPLTNITPKVTAARTPSRVPMKLISSVEFSVTPARVRTVSTPSRRIIRKTKRNTPIRELPLASDSSLPSISPFIFLPVRIMKMIMVMTKKAAASMTQPSTMS